MKNTTWIALATLAGLVGVFFLIQDEPTRQIDTPVVIEEIDDLSRLEIVPPTTNAGEDADATQLVVLEKRDGTWWMSRPVESRLSRAAEAQLAKLFSEPTEADDIEPDPKKLDDYELGEGAAVRVSAYGEDSDAPAVELEVGEQITVERTGVKRTYLRKAGESDVYRARIALGDFVRKDVSELRAKPEPEPKNESEPNADDEAEPASDNEAEQAASDTEPQPSKQQREKAQ